MEKINIRYQNWIMASVVALVLVVATIFLFTVHRTFNQLAEESAAGRFTLIGQQADAKLETLVLQSGRFVTAQSRVGLDHFVMGGRINTQDMVQAFLGSLEADPTLYSHYFGLANDEFLQVIAIREDLRTMAALKAPKAAILQSAVSKTYAVTSAASAGSSSTATASRSTAATRRPNTGRPPAPGTAAPWSAPA